MTGKVVPFGNRNKIPTVKKVRAAGDGEELEMPSAEDLSGFINVMNYLALQSATNCVEINLLVDELNIEIKHHDDLFESNGVTAASIFAIMANVPYDAEDMDKKQTIAHLLAAFDRLDIDKYDDKPTT